MTIFTGTVPTFAAGDNATVVDNLNTLRDVAKAESEAWTSYGSTASFTASGSNPTGGTWTGKYKRVGKSIEFWVRIVQGAGVGTGTYAVALPTAPITNYPAHFDVFFTDTSTTFVYRGITFGLITSTVSLAYDSNGAANAPLTALTNTAPFAMAAGDVIEVRGSYEAA